MMSAVISNRSLLVTEVAFLLGLLAGCSSTEEYSCISTPSIPSLGNVSTPELLLMVLEARQGLKRYGIKWID